MPSEYYGLHYRYDPLKYKPDRSTTLAGPSVGVSLAEKVSNNGVNLIAGGELSVVRAEKKFRINDGVSFNAGLNLNANTKVSIGADGISGSFLGFGVSVGSNTSIKTPIGSLGLSFF